MALLELSKDILNDYTTNITIIKQWSLWYYSVSFVSGEIKQKWNYFVRNISSIFSLDSSLVACFVNAFKEFADSRISFAKLAASVLSGPASVTVWGLVQESELVWCCKSWVSNFEIWPIVRVSYIKVAFPYSSSKICFS